KETRDKIRDSGASSLVSGEIDFLNRIEQDGMMERLYRHLFHRSHQRRLFSDWNSVISLGQEPIPIAHLCSQVDTAWLDALSRYPLGSIALDGFRRKVGDKMSAIAIQSDSAESESATTTLAEEWLKINGARELLHDDEAGIRLIEFPYHGRKFFVVQQSLWRLLIE